MVYLLSSITSCTKSTDQQRIRVAKDKNIESKKY